MYFSLISIAKWTEGNSLKAYRTLYTAFPDILAYELCHISSTTVKKLNYFFYPNGNRTYIRVQTMSQDYETTTSYTN